MHELDRKLWLTADRNTVVEDGDPEAAFLLGNEGTEITDAEAERLGLGDKPAAKKAAAPANKSRKAAANKAAGADSEDADSE